MGVGVGTGMRLSSFEMQGGLVLAIGTDVLGILAAQPTGVVAAQPTGVVAAQPTGVVTAQPSPSLDPAHHYNEHAQP